MTQSPAPIPSPARARIGVVYLARLAEGLQAFQKFKESYLRSAPGIDHELIVVYKGAQDEAALDGARAVFADVPHLGLTLPDTGFDIGSYLMAAAQVGHEYLCCINTFTELNAPGWLAALYSHLRLQDVGIVGATASYESIYDSLRLLDRVVWLCSEDKIRFDPKVAVYFEFLIRERNRGWLERELARPASGWGPKAIIRLMKRKLKARRRWPKLSARMEQRWAAATSERGPLARLYRFPSFPNPHIRSNGFMVRRAHLLGASHREIGDKLDACEFESGEDSLTWQLRRQGLRAVLVDRGGKGYDVADWWHSDTFRLRDQGGLLISDNRTREFDRMSRGSKATHVWITWGDYLGAPPRDLPRLGLSFPVDPSRTTP